jgi:2-keto-3-deoxy-L-rhamnonate aldolase RhmA
VRVNTTKQKLEAGKAVYGAIVSEVAPNMVEALAMMGMDFVFLDGEHGTMDSASVEHMVRAAEVFGITPIARVPNGEASTLLRFLDRGVQGLIVPHCNTAEQVQSVVRAARYFPDGNRGMAGGRAHDYGFGPPQSETIKHINANVLVVPMIEEVEAVNNLDSILKVPGVDVLHVASSDLGQSMGNPGREVVREAMKGIVSRIAAGGIPAGVGGNSPTDHEGIAELVGLGGRFVTISALALMGVGVKQFREGIDAAIGRRPFP